MGSDRLEEIRVACGVRRLTGSEREAPGGPSSVRALPAAGVSPRRGGPPGVFPLPPLQVSQPPAAAWRAPAGLRAASRPANAMPAVCRAVAIALLAAAVLAMPVPAASHPHPDDANVPEAYEEACREASNHHDPAHADFEPPPYDFCHSPGFASSQRTMTLTDDARLGTDFDGVLPRATDADHEGRSSPTMVYELRDGNPGSPLPQDYDDEPTGDALGDAAAFRIAKFGDDSIRLVTLHDHNYNKPQYRLFLVACDGNFRRGYMTLIINNSRASVGSPDPEPDPDPNGVGNSGFNDGSDGGRTDGNNGDGGERGGRNARNAGSPANEPPVFPGDPITLSFPEDAPAGRNIGAPVTATDTDGDPLTYALEGPDAAAFDIDPLTGQLRTRPGAEYDYETKPSYTVTVRATDPSGADAIITVAISVMDVPEAPVFETESTTRGFPEDAPPGWNIGAPVTATDPDGDPLAYALEGADAAAFVIDPQTGQLKTRAGVAYDYETRPSYTVTVRATDPSGADAIITVAITVTDVTEAPVFEMASTTRGFPEDAPPGWNIGAPVTATDPDGDPLAYALEGADAAAFDIDPLTGQLKTRAGVAYDYETRPSYAVTVRATDEAGASASILVSILVIDVSEAPAFAASSTTRSFPEDAPPGWNIGAPVTATDPDGDLLAYTLEGADAAAFDIDPLTGQLKTRAGVAYDYETRPSYAVTVRATDPSGADAIITVAITVTDVPEAPAFAASSTTRSFPEDAPPGWNIGAPVTATDPDGDPLTYALEGADAASFDIVASTGQLQTRSGVAYDYETRPSYAVTVRATDPSEASATIAVAVTVTDVPERPAFAIDSTTRSLAENTPAGRNIGAPVTATDPDGDPLTYTLEGADAASFDIVASTGQLQTRSGVNYDYEARTRYSVTVRATDPGRASDTAAVAIHVTDVDEKPATPAAPTVRAVEGSSSGLRVRWRAPALNGGPRLTGYDVEYRPGSSGRWHGWPHSGTATATTLTGLGGSTAYQVRVRALNGETPSDWSRPGSGRTNATVSAWLARFGRTVAQQMLQGVEDRLASPRQTGLRATVAGHGLGSAPDGVPAPRRAGWAPAYLGGGIADTQRPPVSPLLTEPQLLMGSGFELSGGTPGGGVVGAWGRGGLARFDGVERTFLLDGDITTGTLGVDYANGPWLAGLALSHAWATGSHGRAHGQDGIEALLTGLYPYAGLKVTDRFSVWGTGGFGRGVLTLAPKDAAAMETDIGLGMAAVAARGVLLKGANGFAVALQTDGFWVRTTSERVIGLLAADVVVTRLRLGLESSYRALAGKASSLVPKLEIGVRHDGGDAETGWGVDVGGGLLWSAPLRGVSVAFGARSLIGHQTEGFRDWGVSGRLRYDRDASSERGLSASVESSIGPSLLDGRPALLDPGAPASPATHDAAGARQLSATAAYGFPILGGRFTGAPWVGAGVVENGRDYRLGYRVSSARRSGAELAFGIEGVRRENGGAEVEHAVGLRLGMHW